MGHPKRAGGRYTAPKRAAGEHVAFDLEMPGVGVHLPRSGLVQLPIEFSTWLESDGLLDEFDDHWSQCVRQGVHGDALTAFATVHEASPDVLEAIRTFGLSQDGPAGLSVRP